MTISHGMMEGRGRSLLAAIALLLATPLAGFAATPLKSIRYMPDITVSLGGVTVNHDNVAEDDLAGGVSLVDIGAIPAGTAITAYDDLDNSGGQLLSFAVPVTLPGGLTARTGDVVLYDGSTYTLAFDATAAGVPAGTIVDAVAEIGPADLLLSFDVTVAIGGVTAADEDLVRIHNGVVSLFFDGSMQGIAAGLDLDAAHCIDSNGHLLLSFDGPGSVGGVNFGPADVLEFTPSSGLWQSAYVGLAQHTGWLGANLFGLSAELASPPAQVPPTFGGPGNPGTGIFVGSTRVFGVGTVHAKADDTCIAIYAVGPNGVLDVPPGSVDDELLGTGGTNAAGNFVDSAENLGIPLNRPLRVGDVLFATDVCADLTGAVAFTTFGAPALSPAMTAALVGLLLAIGALGLRRRAS